MQPIASPIFQSFLVLLSQNQIDGWTCNQIWNTLNPSKEEKQRMNQQQLYRLLRKLIKQGYLTKKINLDNPRLSIFIETESMNSIRQQFNDQSAQNDFLRVGLKTKELLEKQKLYENQIRASEQALIEFPQLTCEIMKKKRQLLHDVEQLRAYADFLRSLI